MQSDPTPVTNALTAARRLAPHLPGTWTAEHADPLAYVLPGHATAHMRSADGWQLLVETKRETPNQLEVRPMFPIAKGDTDFWYPADGICLRAHIDASYAAGIIAQTVLLGYDERLPKALEALALVREEEARRVDRQEQIKQVVPYLSEVKCEMSASAIVVAGRLYRPRGSSRIKITDYQYDNEITVKLSGLTYGDAKAVLRAVNTFHGVDPDRPDTELFRITGDWLGNDHYESWHFLVRGEDWDQAKSLVAGALAEGRPEVTAEAIFSAAPHARILTAWNETTGEPIDGMDAPVSIA